ncbi:hypothetical protein H4219_005606 [Mycoemilia scoparia]|uniref:Uncharacterized protein n=1 Tax=Mycoemilia scoparia TaxID=417184 RepID=A0A9W8DNZ5_9FUNG|nr:hypothetical protein H4219_005606 [Mycoemilia scoparia]
MSQPQHQIDPSQIGQDFNGQVNVAGVEIKLVACFPNTEQGRVEKESLESFREIAGSDYKTKIETELSENINESKTLVTASITTIRGRCSKLQFYVDNYQQINDLIATLTGLTTLNQQSVQKEDELIKKFFEIIEHYLKKPQRSKSMKAVCLDLLKIGQKDVSSLSKGN